MSTIQSTAPKEARDTTPSKRKGSPLCYQTLSDTRAQSTPNLTRGEQHGNSSLETPDRPVSHKRAKSASGCSPRAAAVASNDNTKASSPLRTATSCTRKGEYRYEGSRLNHLRSCQDPNCKIRHASMQPSALDDNETISSEPQQQVEDVFTTTTSRNQAKPMRFFSGNDTHKSSEGSPSPNPKSDASAETSEATGEPYMKVHGADEAADPEPEFLHCEAPSSQEKPHTEATPCRIRSKRPADAQGLHRKLQSRFETRLSPKDEEGQMYVIKDLNRPRLCKIGRAKKSEPRAETIANSCGLEIDIVYTSPVSLYIRTEALIQAYLSDLCRPYDCKSCNQTHFEWFEIPAELAIAAVEKWVYFMHRESPYDPKSKELKPFWSLWLRFYHVASADVDFNAIRTRWDRIISPSKLDHFNYKLENARETLWELFWPVYATIGWTATFIAFQHPFAFILMVTSVVGTFISMSHDFHPVRRAATKHKL